MFTIVRLDLCGKTRGVARLSVCRLRSETAFPDEAGYPLDPAAREECPLAGLSPTVSCMDENTKLRLLYLNPTECRMEFDEHPACCGDHRHDRLIVAQDQG
jgi:hypothetical protein